MLVALVVEELVEDTLRLLELWEVLDADGRAMVLELVAELAGWRSRYG